MKKKSLLLSFLPFLTGCVYLPPIDDGDNPPIKPDPTIFDSEDELYKAFFNPESKIELKLKFTNQSIYKLAQYGASGDFSKEEQYHPCDLIVTINDVSRTYEGVGARMKGNTSINGDFVDEKGSFDKKTARWCHFKLSFSQTFSSVEDNDYYTETFESADAKKERKDRKFGGMKKFDMKWNKNYDQTFTKECYASYCLREADIVTSRANLVNVTVESEKDSFTALYNVFEAYDKQMMKKYFKGDEAKGNLYKCKWPVNFLPGKSVGVESATFSPDYDLKTNDDDTEHVLLKNFINVINAQGSADDIKDTLESVVDIEYFLRYSAMMWVIGNPDDMRNNENNSYIYFNGEDDKMIPIPYDNDRCFGILHDWGIDTSTVWATTTKKCGQERAWNENPLLWRTIIEEKNSDVSYSDNYPVIQEWKETYLSLCKEYAEKYLSKEKFKAYNDQFYYSNKDISKGGSDNMSFGTYATNKLETLKNI